MDDDIDGVADGEWRYDIRLLRGVAGKAVVGVIGDDGPEAALDRGLILRGEEAALLAWANRRSAMAVQQVVTRRSCLYKYYLSITRTCGCHVLSCLFAVRV